MGRGRGRGHHGGRGRGWGDTYDARAVAGVGAGGAEGSSLSANAPSFVPQGVREATGAPADATAVTASDSAASRKRKAGESSEDGEKQQQVLEDYEKLRALRGEQEAATNEAEAKLQKLIDTYKVMLGKLGDDDGKNKALKESVEAKVAKAEADLVAVRNKRNGQADAEADAGGNDWARGGYHGRGRGRGRGPGRGYSAPYYAPRGRGRGHWAPRGRGGRGRGGGRFGGGGPTGEFMDATT